jgi:Tfp pilus assembly protein PilN
LIVERQENMLKKIFYGIVLVGLGVLAYLGITKFIGYQKQIEDALAALDKRQEELKKERQELDRLRKEMDKTDKKVEGEVFVTKGDKN